MSKKEMSGCGNWKFCTVPVTVEELVGRVSYQLIPRVRTSGLHFSVLPKVNREVEDTLALKLKERFCERWLRGTRRFFEDVRFLNAR